MAPRIVEFSAGLKGDAKTKAGASTKRIAASIFLPHLEHLPLDCSNCRGRAFVVVVSPRRGEHDTAADIQGVQCIRCGQKYRVWDGTIGGKRDDPVTKVIKAP
ncbi:MAG: hypothetical protein ACR2QC_07975 [Gammaproteobacteria bacterium]